MLKMDLHVHTNDDPKHSFIPFNAKEIITEYAKRGYEVMSITNHNLETWSSDLAKFAGNKGILLIPGVEANVEGRHVLFYNFNYKEIEKLVSIQGIPRLKKEFNLVIAPHPYFFRFNCLGYRLEENISSFDAIEYSHFYTWWLNRNHKGEKLSVESNLPLVGNSDAHSYAQIDTTYSYVESEKTLKAVISSIKSGKVRVQTKPLSTKTFLMTAFMQFNKKMARKMR